MSRMVYLYLHELKKMLLRVPVLTSILAFWLISSLFLWIFNSSMNLTNQLEADIKPYVLMGSILLTVLSSLLANQSLVEEKRFHTDVLQAYSPFSSAQYLSVKFAVLKTLLFVAIIPSFLHFYFLFFDTNVQ